MDIQIEQLGLVFYPHPVLRTKAKPLDAVTDQVCAVISRMFEIMHQAKGVGLAAPQVGLSWRLFVANPTGQPQDDLAFINPTLSQPARETADHEEGCLSLPHVTASIRRPQAVTIDALDTQGQPFSLSSDDLAARVWQHEYDHLDGVLILDRMTPIDKMANRQALRELERVYHDQT